MRFKKFVYLFSVLLLISALLPAHVLSTTKTTFHGDGVVVDLTFPEEAHPDDYIWHNATLTANIAFTLRNLTLIIRAPVNSIWQKVTSWSLSNRVLQENASLMEEIYFQLPLNVSGTLQCFIYVNTTHSANSLFATFYTTHVSTLTFSEMQSLYNEMLANYTALQKGYDLLLNTHEGVLADYSRLLANYTTLLSERDELWSKYNSTVSIYESLMNSYEGLSDDYGSLNADYMSNINEYNDLQADYEELNSTRYDLQRSYNMLESIYEELNQSHTDLQTELDKLRERTNVLEGALNVERILILIFTIVLVALIVLVAYIRRKKQEPYVVVRKELVTMKKEDSFPQTRSFQCVRFPCERMSVFV